MIRSDNKNNEDEGQEEGVCLQVVRKGEAWAGMKSRSVPWAVRGRPVPEGSGGEYRGP